MIATSPDTGKARPFTKRGRWRWVALFGVVVVVGVIIAGLATSDQGSKSSARGLCSDKLTQMERSGSTQAMFERHQSMMEQMRVGLSPQMQQLMDADPMWKLMRSGDFTQMMQDQQQQIDRSLGAALTCATP